MTVDSDTDSVVVTIDGRSCELSRADASQLQEDIGDALTERREFFRTAGEHREDGSYVVERRAADSAGNAKVFESFEHLRRLYDRLPDEFSAEDVGRTGITGSRRHMLVRHFAEHPAFDCTIASRNPLSAGKEGEPEVVDGSDPEVADGRDPEVADGRDLETADGGGCVAVPVTDDDPECGDGEVPAD